MQSSPTPSLWRLSGAALRSSLLLLHTDHPRRNLAGRKDFDRESPCWRVTQALLTSHRQHAGLPNLPKLPAQITLRKSNAPLLSFGTLTLFPTLHTISLHAGDASGLSRGGTPSFRRHTRRKSAG